MSRAKLAPHVRWVELEGVVFIIDLRRGQYYGLNKEHTGAWKAVAGEADEEQNCDAGVHERLLKTATERGWLSASERKKERLDGRRSFVFHPARFFPRLRAFLCLVRSYTSLRLLGFWKSYAWASSVSVSAPRLTGDISQLESAKAAFSSAERFIVSRKGMEDCLPRTLALFVFLRLMGFNVQHCIGIKYSPFVAHAWVESSTDRRPETPSAFTIISVIE